MAKRKHDVRVGMIEKVREFYVTKKILGIIKVDKITDSERWGDEIHVYYDDASNRDRFYVNGIEFVAKEKEQK